MSDKSTDLKQIADEYREYLAAELALVDAFIAMAEHLVDRADGADHDLILFTEVPRSATLH